MANSGCNLTLTTTCTDPTLAGSSNGISTSSVVGGTTPYSYTWSSGHTTSNATGLSAGNIGLTLTDGIGCTITSSCILNDPLCSLTVTQSQNDVSCFGFSNGEGSITVTGGVDSLLIFMAE